MDVLTLPAPKGGHILICSDGLWGVVTDPDILNIVNNANHPQLACEELVKAANAAGGPDNITAVLIRLPPEQ